MRIILQAADNAVTIQSRDLYVGEWRTKKGASLEKRDASLESCERLKSHDSESGFESRLASWKIMHLKFVHAKLLGQPTREGG